MKNIMTTRKTLAVAGITLGLALGAQAETTYDYTIHLKDGDAYKTNVYTEAYKITSTVATMGLSCSDGIWTMKNFNFKTSARYGIKAGSDTSEYRTNPLKVTIKLEGANSIQGGDSRESQLAGVYISGDLVLMGTDPKSDSLTVSAGSCPSDNGGGAGIWAVGVTVLNATVNASAAESALMAAGIRAVSEGGSQSALAVTNASVVAQSAKATMSLGVYLPGPVLIGEGGTVRAMTTGANSQTTYAYAVLSSTADHDASAYDAQSLEPLTCGMGPIAYIYTNATTGAIATNVILTAKGAPAPTPTPIEAKPNVAPEHATIAAVLTNGVEAAEIAGKAGYYPAWSNGTAAVVYKADADWCFENGATEVTNKLDTSVNPAVNKSGEVAPPLGRASVQLGVVAQRYPWNGVLDVQYCATYVKDTPATITVEANGQTYTQDVTISAGVHTIEFTKLSAEIKAKDAKVTLTLK